MSDILYDAAVKYGSMLSKGYNIVLGRRQKEYHIQLRFTKDAFYHLVGMQHLTDIKFSSKNRERVYKDIMSGKITEEFLKKSIFYEKYFIEERITYLTRLEEMLDSCNVLFLINHKEYMQYTRIFADYLCEYMLPENNAGCLYFFAVKIGLPNGENICHGCSFFKKHDIDYRRGTSEAKLLLNEKVINVGTDMEKVVKLYKHSAYQIEVG